MPAGVSSISLRESGHDAHGIVFGVVETALAATLDPTAKTLTINVAGVAPVPLLGGWGLLALALALPALGWHRRWRRG